MASNDLFQLIKSLKQSEKRYFKIYSSKHEKGIQSNYVKLFDAIDKQEEYNEEKLLKKFQNELFAKQFSVTKNYLLNFILRSLRAYQSKQSPELKIIEGLKDVRILYNRGLFKLAAKRLKKLKKQAYDYEIYDLLIKILKLEDEITLYLLDLNKYEIYFEEYCKEMNYVLAVNKNNVTFQELVDKAYLRYRRFSSTRSKEDLVIYEDILAHPLMQHEEKALSVNAKLHYYDVYSFYYMVQEDFEKASYYEQKQLDLLDEHPKIRDLDIYSYFMEVSNLYLAYLEAKKFEQLSGVRKRMTNLFHDEGFQQQLFAHEKLMITFVYNCREWDYFFQTCQFEKALEFVPKIAYLLQKGKKVLEIEDRQHICFELARFYFCLNDLDAALTWNNKVEGYYKEGQITDSICFVRLLKLFLYFDMGESYYDLLKYEIKSTRRFLIRHKRLYKIEEVSLLYLKRLVDNPLLVTSFKLWLEFAQALTDAEQSLDEAHYKNYLDISGWIESKLKNQALRTIIQKKFEQENALKLKNIMHPIDE